MLVAWACTHTGSGYEVSNQGDSGHTMLINGACGATPGGSWRRPCLPMPPSNVSICSGNCSYWGSQQFLNTTDPSSAPDIITIMLGTNDAKYCNWNGPINGEPRGAGTQFASDYVKMVQLFKALPSKPKVFVVLPPPGISQCQASNISVTHADTLAKVRARARGEREGVCVCVCAAPPRVSFPQPFMLMRARC